MSDAAVAGVEVTRRPVRAWVVLALSVGVLLVANGFARFGYALLLPAMRADLRLSYSAAGLLATANFAAFVPMTLLSGVLAARYGPGRVTSVGLLVAAAGMLGTATLSAYSGLVVAQAAVGLGAAASLIPTVGTVPTWFRPARRGLASGVMMAGAGLGLVGAGVWLPSLLAGSTAEWRRAWWIMGVLTVALAVGVGLGLRANPSAGRPALGGAIVSLLGDRGLWLLSGITGLFGLASGIYGTFFGAYLTSEAGVSAAAAGGLWAYGGGLSLVSGLLWGLISDRLGRRAALAGYFAVQVVAFLLFAEMRVWVSFVVATSLFGITFWGFPAVLAAALADRAGSQSPAALGLATLFMGLGQAVGPAVAGVLADRTGSLAVPLLIAAAASALGLALTPLNRHR